MKISKMLFYKMLIVFVATGVIYGCTGSGIGAVAGGTFSYANDTVLYPRTVAITSNAPAVAVSGATYSINPSLPAGLSLDTATGAISGTPSAESVETVYTVTATKSGVSTTATVTITVQPYLVFSNGQAASFAIGQPNLTTVVSNTTQAGLAQPYGNMALHNNTLYVGSESNRVTTYSLPIAADGPNSVNVLGQALFTTSTFGNANNEFKSPNATSISGGKLVVAEYGNRRAVVFSAVPSADGTPANVVVGQSAFGATSTTCDQATFGDQGAPGDGPEAMVVAGGKLIVADSACNRILIFNSIPTTDGASADLVLGQANFTDFTANRGGPAAADTLTYPSGVWSDGTRLIVADKNNHRVLIWNTFPTINGQAADVVIGQAGFTAGTFGTTSSTFSEPYQVYSNGTQIFVADKTNDRVLIWNSFPTTNGQAADRVLGQIDFVSSGSGTTATTMDYPAGFSSDSTRLYLAEYVNNRVLVYTTTQ